MNWRSDRFLRSAEIKTDRTEFHRKCHQIPPAGGRFSVRRQLAGGCLWPVSVCCADSRHRHEWLFQQHLFAAFERESSGVTTGIRSGLGRHHQAAGGGDGRNHFCESTRKALFYACTFSLLAQRRISPVRPRGVPRGKRCDDNALNPEIWELKEKDRW